MIATIKTFKANKVANVEVNGAPSKEAAVRMDAERLVKVAIDNGVADTDHLDCLSSCFLGSISVDLYKISEFIFHVVHYNEDCETFASTVVETNK